MNAADNGLIGALARLARSLLSHAGTRLKLIGFELEQEKQRLLAPVLSLLFAAALMLMSLMLWALAIVAYFWDGPYRLEAIVWMALCSSIGMFAAGLWAVRKIAEPSFIFSASLEEFADDESALGEDESGDQLGAQYAGS